MAIDTRSKRASVLGLALAPLLTLPLADGTIGQADRQHIAYVYAGISTEVSAPSSEGLEFTLPNNLLHYTI